MFKRLLLYPCIIVCVLFGGACAETTEVDVSVSIALPFAIHSVDNADLGSMFVKSSGMTVIVDAASIVPISDPAVGNTTPDFTAGQISRGAPPTPITTERTAVVYIQTVAADVDIAVSLVGTPTLEIPFSSSPTPITISGITSNVALFNATSSSAGNYMSLAIGPIMEIPPNAEMGTYTGSVSVDIVAI